MRFFLIGVALPFGVLLGSAIVRHSGQEALTRSQWAALSLDLLVVPVLAAWLGAEWASAGKRSRRALDHRLALRWECVGIGMLAGVIGVAWSVLALVLLDRALPDAVLTAAGAMAGSVIVVMLMPRVKPGTCLRCGYDLAGATVGTGGRCSECGWDVMT
jgi:hypothetical protein